MQHTISHHLAQARLAGLRHHGQRATQARALRRSAGSVPFLAPPRPLSPPGLAAHPLAGSAPAAA
jgi:hypothetical protein